MRHTPLIKEERLHQQSDLMDRGLMPDLLRRLITASVPEPEKLRIPIRGSTGQSGWDGILVTPVGYKEFVPEGKSYWEVGTGGDPKGKASDVFKTRTETVSEAEQSSSTFVFVTSRSAYHRWNEKEQSEWVATCKSQSKWKDVRVIDANVLEHWLEHFPAIDLWVVRRTC